jgi:hypothetical protein
MHESIRLRVMNVAESEVTLYTAYLLSVNYLTQCKAQPLGNYFLCSDLVLKAMLKKTYAYKRRIKSSAQIHDSLGVNRCAHYFD